jgi:hypothetical protein
MASNSSCVNFFSGTANRTDEIDVVCYDVPANMDDKSKATNQINMNMLKREEKARLYS